MAKGRGIPYSVEEMAWLEANRTMVISDYHRAFLVAFPDRMDVAQANLHALRKRLGWKVGRDPSRYKGRNTKYGAAELGWLRANCTLSLAACHEQFTARFPDQQGVTPEKLHSLRKRFGFKTGRTGHFAKGQAPANKGKPCPPGVGGRHPNAQRTQFKKGQQPQNTKYLGHERVNVDGYVEISVAEPNPYTGFERRYVHKHVWLWELANGPVPERHCLKCLDGDKTNTDPSNWEAIPRTLLPLLNGGRHKKSLAYDTASPEVKPAVMALAKVKHQARELRRKAAGG